MDLRDLPLQDFGDGPTLADYPMGRAVALSDIKTNPALTSYFEDFARENAGLLKLCSDTVKGPEACLQLAKKMMEGPIYMYDEVQEYLVRATSGGGTEADQLLAQLNQFHLPDPVTDLPPLLSPPSRKLKRRELPQITISTQGGHPIILEAKPYEPSYEEALFYNINLELFQQVEYGNAFAKLQLAKKIAEDLPNGTFRRIRELLRQAYENGMGLEACRVLVELGVAYPQPGEKAEHYLMNATLFNMIDAYINFRMKSEKDIFAELCKLCAVSEKIDIDEHARSRLYVKLGIFYLEGKVTPADYQSATFWLELVDEKKFHSQELRLAKEKLILLEMGKTNQQAQQAVNESDVRWLNEQGLIYLEGKGVPMDLELARMYFEKSMAIEGLGDSKGASLHNNVEACFSLLRINLMEKGHSFEDAKLIADADRKNHLKECWFNYAQYH